MVVEIVDIKATNKYMEFENIEGLSCSRTDNKVSKMETVELRGL